MKLSEYRRSIGMTQRDLANLIGVSDVALSRYESGRVPESSVMRRIFEVSEGRVSPNDFFEIPDQQPGTEPD